MKIKEILKKFNIYILSDAAKVLNIKEDTLLKQCNRGKYEYLRLGTGKRTFLLVKLDL
jgi:hypothetical protein